MAHEPEQPHAAGAGDHVVPVRTYALVFAALMFLLLITVTAAFFDFDTFVGERYVSMTIALLIATTKALFIILFFMHIKYGTKVTSAFAASAFVWLGILLVLTFSDYMTRQSPVTAPNKTGPDAPSHNVVRPSPKLETVRAEPREGRRPLTARDIHARAIGQC